MPTPRKIILKEVGRVREKKKIVNHSHREITFNTIENKNNEEEEKVEAFLLLPHKHCKIEIFVKNYVH